MRTPREFQVEFAARVKWAREHAGFSQERIAELLHLTQPAYAKYESTVEENYRNMPNNLLADFCDITRVGLEWLLTGRGDPTPGRATSRPISRPRTGAA
jgi:transcriptional regulator with XRE-family HTH domain